jgi:hypothetical protein
MQHRCRFDVWLRALKQHERARLVFCRNVEIIAQQSQALPSLHAL